MAEDKWHTFLEELQALLKRHKVKTLPPNDLDEDWFRTVITIELKREPHCYLGNEIKVRLYSEDFTEDGWKIEKMRSINKIWD